MHYRGLSIISVCYDRWLHLSHAFRTWASQDYPNVEHVVVVAGPDDSPKALAQSEHFTGCVVQVQNLPDYRPSFLRNIGAQHARGDYLAFADADILLANEWASFCMARLLKGFQLVTNRFIVANEDSGGASGTHAMCRWLFEKVRGYNENLDGMWGYEDTDLFIRAQRAGGRITAYPVEMVRHLKHGDEERGRHFSVSHKPRSPKVFLQQMRICEADDAVHRFEANRVVRLETPPVEVTVIER